ncbi:MAG TPA: hypothetical protein VFH45_12490 [Acidimicrobiales bacterium]|nr:hypothetical protein [Acidimicrobiales bacterium]
MVTGDDGGADLQAVADELYRLDPAEFTATRDARAGEVRKAGDRALSDAIKALRRPSTAAWVVNTAARRLPDEVARLADLGERLRHAQASLSGDQLRQLGRQRQQVVSGLARQAAAEARGLGHPVSEPIEREVESTFEAALADPAAAEAVRAGRLVRSLEHTGVGPVDLEGAQAAGGAPAASRPGGGGAAAEPGRDGGSADDTAARRAAVDAARQQAEEAEREAADAAAAAQVAADAADEATKRARAAREELTALEERLGEARALTAEAEAAEAEAAAGQRRAEQAAASARSRAERARAHAEALAGGVPPSGSG